MASICFASASTKSHGIISLEGKMGNVFILSGHRGKVVVYISLSNDMIFLFHIFAFL